MPCHCKKTATNFRQIVLCLSVLDVACVLICFCWTLLNYCLTLLDFCLTLLDCCWTLLGFVGPSWHFLALPLAFPGLSQLFLVFDGFCWVLTRVIIAGGERSERAKRASEALWCFLWVSLAYPCFCWRALAFSCFLLLRFFACCLAFSFEWYLGIPSLMLYSVFGCSLPCFVLSCFTLCQHFLKKIALPVHLLRQVGSDRRLADSS